MEVATPGAMAPRRRWALAIITAAEDGDLRLLKRKLLPPPLSLCSHATLASLWLVNNKSKFHWRSSNLFRVLIPVPVLAKRAFNTLNLFHYVIPVLKLENQTITFSNLFNHVIPILKLDFESYMGQNKAI